MMKNKLRDLIDAECPWRDTLHWYPSTDSTNTRAKALAASGAPQGSVVLSGSQSAGRGRMGRSFHSPAGKGIYLSVLLRPDCPVEKLMHLTCAVGVAVCNAVEAVTGFRPGIKWINDLVAEGKKLGGILTELSVDPKSAQVQYAIVGIGINCTGTSGDFPAELHDIAISLEAVTGEAVCIPALAAAIITELWKTDAILLKEPERLLSSYRRDCVTLGKPVVVHQGTAQRIGIAADLDHRGGLIVELSDGTRETVTSGEVSVRGLFGYT